MSVYDMMALAEEIEVQPVCEQEKERMMIQAADLVRFKEAYGSELKVIRPFAGLVSIVTTGNTMAGVYFCDILNPDRLVKQVRKQIEALKVQEIWLVMVRDGAIYPQGPAAVNDLALHRQLQKQFNRVFVLNFYKSSLHQL